MPTTVSYGIGGFDPEHPNGNIVSRLVDNGDGTGTLTTYDANGDVLDTDSLTGLALPAPVDIAGLLAETDPEHVAWAVTVGATLASRAGDLYAALEDISLANTARPAIEIVTDSVLAAVE